MPRKQAGITKVTFASTERVTRRNSLVGAKVVADLRDEATSTRTLFVEREHTASATAPAKSAAKKRRATVASAPPKPPKESVQTAFPGPEV